MSIQRYDFELAGDYYYQGQYVEAVEEKDGEYVSVTDLVVKLDELYKGTSDDGKAMIDFIKKELNAHD